MKQIRYQLGIGMMKCFLLFHLFTFSPLPAGAQEDAKMREVFARAENDYKIGRIEEARDALLQHLNTFQGNLRQNALRLIALICLDEYDVRQAEQYTTKLLELNPYYSP